MLTNRNYIQYSLLYGLASSGYCFHTSWETDFLMRLPFIGRHVVHNRSPRLLLGFVEAEFGTGSVLGLRLLDGAPLPFLSVVFKDVSVTRAFCTGTSVIVCAQQPKLSSHLAGQACLPHSHLLLILTDTTSIFLLKDLPAMLFQRGYRSSDLALTHQLYDRIWRSWCRRSAR